MHLILRSPRYLSGKWSINLVHLGFPYNLSKCAFIIPEVLGDYLQNYCFAMCR